MSFMQLLHLQVIHVARYDCYFAAFSYVHGACGGRIVYAVSNVGQPLACRQILLHFV